jgi:hypothetical protein
MLEYFNKLSEEKTAGGKRKYTFAHIYEEVAKKFFVEPVTAERRISKILREQK